MCFDRCFSFPIVEFSGEIPKTCLVTPVSRYFDSGLCFVASIDQFGICLGSNFRFCLLLN